MANPIDLFNRTVSPSDVVNNNRGMKNSSPFKSGGSIMDVFNNASRNSSIPDPVNYNHGRDNYEDYMVSFRPEHGKTKLNSLRAANQSNWQQAGNALGRIVSKVGLTTVGNLASMLDIEDYFNQDDEVGNALTNWLDYKKRGLDKTFNIYRDNPGKTLDVGDFAWWAENGSSIVESAGAFVLTGAITGPLTLAAVGKGVNALKWIRGLEKGARGSSNAALKAEQITSRFLNSAILNQAESIGVATGVYNQVYSNAFEEWNPEMGMPQVEYAKQKAALHASQSVNINRLNIALNMTSAGMFMKVPHMTRQVLKDITKKNTLKKVGYESAQEYLEEDINMIAENAALADSYGEDYGLSNAFDDMASLEGFEAGLLGAMGGGGQTMLSAAYRNSKISGKKDENGQRVSLAKKDKERYTRQQEELKKLKEFSETENIPNATDAFLSTRDAMLLYSQIEEARVNGDDSKAEALTEKLLEAQSLTAFENGTTEQLIEAYTAFKSMTEEEATAKGYTKGENGPAKLSHTKRADAAIQRIEQLESAYINAQEFVNSREVYFNRAKITQAEKYIDEATTERTEVEAKINKRFQAILQGKPELKTFYDVVGPDGEVVRRETIDTSLQSLLNPDLTGVNEEGKTRIKILQDKMTETSAAAVEDYKALNTFVTSSTEKVTEIDKDYATLISDEKQDELKQELKDAKKKLKKDKRQVAADKKKKAAEEKVKNKSKNAANKNKNADEAAKREADKNAKKAAAEANDPNAKPPSDKDIKKAEEERKAQEDTNRKKREKAKKEKDAAQAASDVTGQVLAKIKAEYNKYTDLDTKLQFLNHIINTQSRSGKKLTKTEQQVVNWAKKEKNKILKNNNQAEETARKAAEELGNILSDDESEDDGSKVDLAISSGDNSAKSKANNWTKNAAALSKMAEMVDNLEKIGYDINDFAAISKYISSVVGTDKMINIFPRFKNLFNALADTTVQTELTFEDVFLNDGEQEKVASLQAKINRRPVGDEFYSKGDERLVREETKMAADLLTHAIVHALDMGDNGGVVYDGLRTRQGFNNFAYLSRAYEKVISAVQDSVYVKKQDIDDFLNDGLIDPTILDINKYQPGTKITLRPATSFLKTYDNGDIVSYDSLRQREKDENLRENSLVPIGIWADGQLVAYVHDVAWIKTENVLGEVSKQKEILQRIRNHVMDKGSFETEVTQKSYGQLIQASKNKIESVAKRFPDENLGFAISKQGFLMTGKGRKFKGKVIGKASNRREGYTYALLPVGKKDGETMYLPVPLQKEKISEQASESIVQAVQAWIDGVPSDLTKELDNYGYNILTTNGLKSYIGLFVHSVGSDINEIAEKVDSIIHLLDVNTKTNSLDFTRGKGAGGKLGFYKGMTTKAAETTMAVFKAHIKEHYTRFDIAKLGTTKYVVPYISSDGKVSSVQNTYTDHIKLNTVTNLMSIKLPNGNYAYTLQPVIKFDVKGVPGIKQEDVADPMSITLDLTTIPTPVAEEVVVEAVQETTKEVEKAKTTPVKPPNKEKDDNQTELNFEEETAEKTVEEVVEKVVEEETVKEVVVEEEVVEETVEKEEEKKRKEEEKKEKEEEKIAADSKEKLKTLNDNLTQKEKELKEANELLEELEQDSSTDNKINTTEEKRQKAEKTVEKLGTNTTEAVEEVLENEVTDDEVEEAAEEDDTVEETKVKIVEKVKEKLKDPEVEVTGTNGFKALVNRIFQAIKKAILVIAILGSTTTVASVAATGDLNQMVEITTSVLGQTLQQTAIRGLSKYGVYNYTKTEEVVNEEAIVAAPTVVELKAEATKVEKEQYIKDNTYFKELGRIKDSHYKARKGANDSLLMIRNQFFNENGFVYVAGPIKSRMEAGETIGEDTKGGIQGGVKGVAHFMIFDDNGVDLTFKTSDAELEQASKDFKRNRIGKDIDSTDYVPVFKRDGYRIIVKYKLASEVEESDITITRLHQYKYGELNWQGKSDIGFSGAWGITTVDGKTVPNFVKTAAGPKAYSRFSGASAVFIFKDAKGNTIVRDVTGSIARLQTEANDIMKQFGVLPNNLTIGVYDAGSYTAKPLAKDGVLETDQYSGYNDIHPNSAGALIIPNTDPNPADGPNPVELGGGLTALLLALRKKKNSNKRITPNDIKKLKTAIKSIETEIANIKKEIVEATENSISDNFIDEDLGDIDDLVSDMSISVINDTFERKENPCK